MWVWVAIGLATWCSLSVVVAFAAGRFFGKVRRRVALQRLDLFETHWWANRAPTRATEHRARRQAQAEIPKRAVRESRPQAGGGAADHGPADRATPPAA